MKITQMAVGPIQANCYIVYKEGSSKAFVIDPGAECSSIMDKLKECGIEEVTHILLTHGHFDHVGAAEEMKSKTGAKVCIHEGDLDMLENPKNSFNVMMGVHFPPCEADIILKGGETIDAAGMDVHTLHTPGHSPGSVCYITEDVMFSGDTLFYMSIGRTDFPGASSAEIYDSINKTLGSLQRDYTVYTGHGPKTTLAFEMLNNPYITREK